MKKPYNKGDAYEDKITNILIGKNILPKEYKRAGASDQPDIEIVFDKKKFPFSSYNSHFLSSVRPGKMTD